MQRPAGRALGCRGFFVGLVAEFTLAIVGTHRPEIAVFRPATHVLDHQPGLRCQLAAVPQAGFQRGEGFTVHVE